MHLEASCQVKYRTMQIAAKKVSLNKFSCAHSSSIFLLFTLEKSVLATQAMLQSITNIVTLKQLLEPLVIWLLLVNKHLNLSKSFLQDMKPPKSLYIEVCLKKSLCKHLDIILWLTNSQHFIDFFTNILPFGCNHLLSPDRVDFQCMDRTYSPLFIIIDWSFRYWFRNKAEKLTGNKLCQIRLRRKFRSYPYTSLLIYSCPQRESRDLKQRQWRRQQRQKTIIYWFYEQNNCSTHMHHTF